MKQISFPENELENIENRFNSDQSVYTIRVSKEFGKYNENEFLVALPWKFKVKVIKVIKAEGIEDFRKKCQFYDELIFKHPDQIELIKKYDKIDIVELKKLD
jgi:hypothetical protein